MLGLFTRPVAFILSGEMAFAYFIEHFPRSFFPVINAASLAIALCFTCLYRDRRRRPDQRRCGDGEEG